MRTTTLTRSLLIGALALSLASITPPAAAPTPHRPATDDNWPQWRGPTGMGLSEETGLPLRWGADSNLLWRAPLDGRGHSSPIVWGDRVFVTTAVEGEVGGEPNRVVHVRDGFYDDNPENRERYIHPDSVGSDRFHTLRVLALDAMDGTVLWDRVAFEGLPFDDRHRGGSYASPTPVTDGEHVYAYFGAQGLYAYDMEGTLAWSVDLGDIPSWGLGDGSSPILHEDLIIVVADRDNGDDSFLVALDKRSGEQVWRTPRFVRTQWSTPLLTEGPRGPELVVSGFQHIAGYDPTTGTERWRAPGLRGNVIATPVASGETVFVSMGYPQKLTRAIRLGSDGDLAGTDALPWTYEKGTAYVASNLLYDDLLYLLADNGILTALDAGSGAVVYEGGRPPIPGRFYASPVGYDGKILLASSEGDMFVVRAGPEHEVLAVNSIDEAIWASPAIAGGKLFVRGAEHLYCFAEVSPGPRKPRGAAVSVLSQKPAARRPAARQPAPRKPE